jgi:hypothetical protein
MFTRAKVEQLKFGHNLVDGDGFTGFGATIHAGTGAYYEGSAAWEFLRGQILREWIAGRPDACGRGGAGTRPWAFWAYDARERRQRIDGGIHPHDNPARQAQIAAEEAKYPGCTERYSRLYYGLPSAILGGEGIDDNVAIYESEAEYIDRLGLWLPNELALGVPLLTAEIAAEKLKLAARANEPSVAELDNLRRFDALLVRLRAKLEATS